MTFSLKFSTENVAFICLSYIAYFGFIYFILFYFFLLYSFLQV